MKLFLIFVLALAASACASSTRQTDAFLEKPNPYPPTQLIEGVPFVEQSAGHCGPATLTMAMNWAGKNISVDQLAPQVFTPGMKGSLQTDMITASRRNGMLALQIEGLETLMAEVSGGHPVIVFENLALSWLPQWHYAIVFGYDLPKQQVILHSGPEAFKRWDLRKFERSWKLGDYWGLVVLPPGQLSATLGESEHLKAIAALEQIGYASEAELSYQSVLKRWPKSLGAHIGLANIAFARKTPKKAVRFLRQATQDHPRSAAAWHNLTIAYAAASMASDAKEAASQALILASPAEKAAFQESLKDWIR